VDLVASLTKSATIATRLVTLLVSAEADADRARDHSDAKDVTTLASDLHAAMTTVAPATADRPTDTTEGGTTSRDAAMTGAIEAETEDPDLVIATRDAALVTTVAAAK
jgi:hypothetical protein